jgi:hypothetical protein
MEQARALLRLCAPASVPLEAQDIFLANRFDGFGTRLHTH